MSGIVYNLGDEVDVNYDGIEDEQGWRKAQIHSVDKAVFIFYISCRILLLILIYMIYSKFSVCIGVNVRINLYWDGFM